MELSVNGKKREVAPGTTIVGLIEALGLRARNVVVEHNGEPVERDAFAEVVLNDGDVVEVVRAVPGG